MEFDESKLYTTVNADELKVGSKVIVADTIQDLEYKVDPICHDNSKSIKTLQEVKNASYKDRFIVETIPYNLAYLIEEPNETQYRPFNDCNELIEHYQKMVNAEIGEKMIYPSLYKPVIWVKSKSCDDCQLMTTGYSVDDEEKSVVWLTDSWITLEKLFDDFVFLDDSPCGVEV